MSIILWKKIAEIILQKQIPKYRYFEMSLTEVITIHFEIENFS